MVLGTTEHTIVNNLELQHAIEKVIENVGHEMLVNAINNL
jgi:hypothetical protein